MELLYNDSMSISPAKHIKLTHSDNLTLRAEYHSSEIQENKRIVTTAIRIIWVGCLVIIVGIVFAYLGRTSAAILTCASGVVTEFISGCVFWLVGKSTESKLKYYMQLSKDEERDKLIVTINSNSNNRFKEKMIEKLVDNHCK